MPIRAVSFDCAQTLLQVDWSPGSFALDCARAAGVDLPEGAEEAYDQLLADRGREYASAALTRDPAASEAFWRSLTAEWLARLGVPGSPDALMAAGEKLMYGADSIVYRLYPDSLPALRALSKAGLRLVVVSNWDSSLHRVLELHGLAPWFEAVFASMEEGCAKPDSAFFRIAERHLGLAPEEILHVGDNPVDDLEGARACGWQAVLIDRTGQAPGSISSLMGLVDLVVPSS